MSEKAKAMVLASLTGDALALGAHWEYDPTALARRHGRVTGYLDPPAGGYHSGKRAGDQTHYGDQTLVLLRSLAERGNFDLDDFARKWRERMTAYDGYIDGATRMTLKIFDFGEGPHNSGSNSTDLAGASRVAPLVCALRHNLEALVEAVRSQTKMTHNHAQVIEAAEFFARTAWGVLGGKSPGPPSRRPGRPGMPAPPSTGGWPRAWIPPPRTRSRPSAGLARPAGSTRPCPGSSTSSSGMSAIWPPA